MQKNSQFLPTVWQLSRILTGIGQRNDLWQHLLLTHCSFAIIYIWFFTMLLQYNDLFLILQPAENDTEILQQKN